jgi:hypothetical protein
VTGWLTVLIAFATFVGVNRTRVNPVLFILGAAIIGLFALRQP